MLRTGLIIKNARRPLLESDVMRAGKGGARGRWRSALIVGLLVISIAMVSMLALQAAFAYNFHRQMAESVLQDYSRMVADEFVRRASVEVGYRGYYSLVLALQQRLGGVADPALPTPAEFDAPPDDRRQPAGELLRTLFLLDPAEGTLTATGAPMDAATRNLLVNAITPSVFLKEPTEEPFLVHHVEEGSAQRTFIYAVLPPAEGHAPLVAGFEVDFDALEAWFQRVVDTGPLLPPSLGDGELSNDLLSLRLDDSAGRPIYASGGDYEPVATTYTDMGETYSGIFAGMTLLTSIHPDAAPRLVIGGLPRSRLPVLLSLLVLTIGLLVAAIHQLHRERSMARMRSEFVSRVSHELRTPLTQIRMFAETLILGRARTVEERRRYLEIVDQEARRLSHLVENILQFSRGDRGAIRLAPRPVEMHALLLDVAEKFQPLAAARKTTLVPALTGEETICLVDDDAMRQVVLNLLDNALKYGPSGQEVRMGLEVDGRKARLWVDDEGPGVPERDRERVWIRWQRLQRHERAAVAGTGIGLTVVRDLVTLQGGRAWVEAGMRAGARFVVELPLHATDPAGSRSTDVQERKFSA